MKKPNFFIVGGARCGTTAIYTFLGQHPDIFMPEVKEPFFFGSDLTIDQNRRTLDWYLSLFANAKDEKRIGEGSTTYLYSKAAAAEIREFNENSQIIIMIRNPVEMMYSVYNFRLSRNLEDAEDFERAIFGRSKRSSKFRAEIEHKIGRKLPDYLDYPRFYEQISRYYEVYDKDKIHIIIYDDFKENTKKIYQKLLDFLEVDSSFCPNFEVINANKRARSRIIQKFLRLMGQFPKKEMLLKYPFVVKSYNTMKQINLVSYQRPEIDPELKMRLRAEYSDDVQKLSVMLGKDLKHWVEG